MATVAQVYKSPPEHFRCRAEFAVWHQGEETYHVMYQRSTADAKPTRVRVDQFATARCRLFPPPLHAYRGAGFASGKRGRRYTTRSARFTLQALYSIPLMAAAVFPR